jgi:hypothetical protein
MLDVITTQDMKPQCVVLRFFYLFKSIYWTMSKRQSANGTQSPMRGTPPLQTVKIS